MKRLLLTILAFGISVAIGAVLLKGFHPAIVIVSLAAAIVMFKNMK